MDNGIEFRELLVKKPFFRVSFHGYTQRHPVSSDVSVGNIEDKLLYDIVTQADFMREFEPTGHKINSPLYYPNPIRLDEKTGRRYEEQVIRCAFPFQYMITIKHLCHLCGNDIEFELSSPTEHEKDTRSFFDFQQGWLTKNMEIVWYEAAKSAKITGDCAVVFFMKNGRLYTKNLSYLNGDTLYPHYDDVTGELNLFARTFSDYDSDGKEVVRWCEVWDNSKLYRYKQDATSDNSIIKVLKGIFGLSGYRLVSEESHNFSSIPVAYHRVEHGSCWTSGQDSIDKYELAVSHMCQNNMAYAFPIMFLKGDEVRIDGDMYGQVKAISMGQDDDAGFLSRPESAHSFDLQLRILLQNIFSGTFTVLPPDVKSGDLPGVAIKLLYSPAVEKAMADAKEFNPFIDKMVDLFKEGYGIETGMSSKFKSLPVFGWIKPYVHQNDAELFTNASTAVQNGYVSRQTASEIASRAGYGKNYEWDRVIREQKEQQQADLLFELGRKGIPNPANPDTTGGSQQGVGRVTDKWGNRPGENNWDEYNKRL